MKRQFKVAWTVIGAAGMVFTTSPSWAGDKAPVEALRVGIVSSLFRDVPKPLAGVLLEQFGTMVQTQTGLATTVSRGEDAFELGRQLAGGEVQLAVFQGIEFAWVRQRHPEFQPLMVIVNQQMQRHGLLVVRADSPAAGFPDLRDKTLALPLHSRAHCHLFLERGCQDAGHTTPQRFFSSFTESANAEDAIDALIDGAVQALVLDGVTLDCFREHKPARSERLKVLVKSAPFPSTIIVYRPGSLDSKRLKLFQEGLLAAKGKPLARQLMMLWRITSFEPVPQDLEKVLADIVQSYPSPQREEKDGSLKAMRAKE